jgi:biopolymer transport protein ExbB
MELLKAHLDAGIIAVLGFMSFLAIAFVIERYLYFARVKLGAFDHPDDLEIALTRHLTAIATVGANAPYVGLLGTVLGIITTFRQLEQGGTMGTAEYSKAVMGGIYEALVATAVGLLVAIPAVIAYNYFQRLVKLLLGEADGLTNMVQALLTDEADRKD